MSMMEPVNGLGIEFFADELRERDAQGRRVASITLDVLDRVPRTNWEMDTLNWCGGQRFMVGGLAEVKEIHERLGRNIEWWEQMQSSGAIIFK